MKNCRLTLILLIVQKQAQIGIFACFYASKLLYSIVLIKGKF
jgi:hypothetical protein